jgi:hypothetical protein
MFQEGAVSPEGFWGKVQTVHIQTELYPTGSRPSAPVDNVGLSLKGA